MLKKYTDEDLTELVDCLIAHPNIVSHIYLDGNRLTDKTGVQLARYLAVSTSIEWLTLPSNRFGDATYLAVASALCFNSSLQFLSLGENKYVNRNQIDMAFVNALIVNPNRPIKSNWTLYDWRIPDHPRLKIQADQFGRPSIKKTIAIVFLIDR
jgi:hypothetical protein